jgi:hypothetical protein
VIDSKSLERALREKPDSTFSRAALLRLVERGADRVHNAFEIAQNFVIPKSQHAIAVCFKKSRALLVSQPPIVKAMLRAVYLNDDARAMTCEIREIGTDRRLSAEMNVFDFELPELCPKLTFCWRRFSSQLTGAGRSRI